MDIGTHADAARTDGIRVADRGIPSFIPKLRRASLRFTDAELEGSFQEQYFRDNVGYVRAGHVLVIGAWAWFGVVLAVLASGPDAIGIAAHLLIALVVGIGITSVSLALSFVHGYARWWQPTVVALVLATSVLSQMHRIVTGHPAGWDGAVASMVVLSFTYAVFRLQGRYAALGGFLVVVCYNATRLLFSGPGDIGLLNPDVYLLALAVAGTAAAFALERFARSLFLRERELDRERERGDALLRNILPEGIIDRLKADEPGGGHGRIAERYVDVTVLFADLVGFTEQAAHMEPDELIVTLDDVFAHWDQLADRLGLEKIKTMGDAYMAVAGVPEDRTDHIEVAAELGLEMRDGLSSLRWPSGATISARIGIACGPVVAGVIGRRKFAYDIWGDTVNAASRLESAAAPGSILVSDAVHQRLYATYVFSGPHVVDLKGKGETTAHTLIGRVRTAAAPYPGSHRPIGTLRPATAPSGLRRISRDRRP